MYKDVTLGALRLLNNNYAGPMALYDDFNKNLFQNTLILNVEQFKGDLLGEDVI